MGYKFRSILAFIIFMAILFSPVPASRSPLPVKNDPRSIIRKKAAKMLMDIPGLKLHKTPLTTQKIVQEEKETGNRVMTSSLQKEINRYIEEDIRDIRIVLNTSDDSDELSEKVEAYGGRIIRKTPGFLAIEIPVDKVEELIQENSSIGYARLPFKFYPTEKISEGVALTGANIFHDTICRGAGVKIAILDGGFKGLTEAQANGELPGNVITRDYSGLGLQTEYYHGTRCAEIIHDMAPDAELHLIKIGDEMHAYEVMKYCIENNIDIVSLSMGTFGSGPGDGTGPVNEAFNSLRDEGILVITSAGNSGNSSYEMDGTTLTFGSHWEGRFTDWDANGLHEFVTSSPFNYYNIIWACPSFNDDGVPETNEVSILMRWDDWPNSDIDYDMCLIEMDLKEGEFAEDFAAVSNGLQNGTQEPVEYISLDLKASGPGTEITEDDIRVYALIVKRADKYTPINIPLEIYLGGTSEFFPFSEDSAISTSISSLTEPADAEKVMAVGAVNYANWETGPQEEFSSQGPTNNWNGSMARIKPDVVGPDGVTTYTNGDLPFMGTSAATPHVAGLAALMLSANPLLTPDELQAIIEDSAIDMGEISKDNQYGWGRINKFLSLPIVKSNQKISESEGNFNGSFFHQANWGHSIAFLGDLNKDGVGDIAVGSPGDEFGDDGKGEVWVLFLNFDGTVKFHQKISETEGNFSGNLNNCRYFGTSVAAIGDLNGDGVPDLAVGSSDDNGEYYNLGAVWILFMNADGTVKSHQKISSTEGNFKGTLDEYDYFGNSIDAVGDLNGDGITDLAVGAYKDGEGLNFYKGAVWILFLNSDGTVKSHQKINNTEGNFNGALDNSDYFGISVAAVGDLNGDGIPDLAVGAVGDEWDDRWSYDIGAVWILFLNTDGTVKSHQKISSTEGNFTGALDNNDNFGSSVAAVGDLNVDGIPDLAVGAVGDEWDDIWGYNKGAVWILFLNTDGTVKSHQKINNIEGNFNGALDNSDEFGSSVAAIGDLNGDGIPDLAVGAHGDDDGGPDKGAVYVLFLDYFPVDLDHDRMPDVWERRYSLNPDTKDAVGDPDQDGLTNIIEYRLRTDPKNSDTDDDGIPDGDEDKNRNGVVDSGETDPANPDTDYDGMPDGWEVQYGLDPLVNDALSDPDNDGYSNLQEYKLGTSPDNKNDHPNPPVASAGGDRTVDEGTVVTLDGSESSDPDDDIASYQWTQISGIPVILSDSTDVALIFIAPDVGKNGDSLKFRLTVTDKGGLQSTDICIVNVEWVRIPPVALEQTLETNEDCPLEITLQAEYDPDVESEIIYTIVDEVSYGSLEGSAPSLIYTPGRDFFGSDSFTFRINDTYSDYDPAEITINVISTVGDLDDNGIIDLKDAVLAIQACTGIDSNAEIYIKEEVNGDGRIGMEDVLYILRKVSERIE